MEEREREKREREEKGQSNKKNYVIFLFFSSKGMRILRGDNGFKMVE